MSETTIPYPYVAAARAKQANPAHSGFTELNTGDGPSAEEFLSTLGAVNAANGGSRAHLYFEIDPAQAVQIADDLQEMLIARDFGKHPTPVLLTAIVIRMDEDGDLRVTLTDTESAQRDVKVTL